MQIQTKKYIFNKIPQLPIVSKPLTTVSSIDTISFKGFRSKEAKSIVALDLDESLTHGSNAEIQKVIELTKKANATLVYATGRNLEKFYETQKKLACKGIDLPLPDFLVARNGLYIYENKNGELVQDSGWETKLTQAFNRDKILNSVKEIAFQPKYLMPDCKNRPANDFNNSKICHFSFWESPKMVQFICDSSISNNIERILQKRLNTDGIKARIIKQKFTKEECDRLCNAEQLEIINPRYSKKNMCTQIDITAANKADGVKYIKDQLGVFDEEILTAGNGMNDKSLVDMTKQNSIFICLGNAMMNLKNYVLKLKNNPNNKFTENSILVQKKGTAGIIEGMETVFKKYRPDLNLN